MEDIIASMQFVSTEKKIGILTQKFLRFVFPIQRLVVTKVSIVPS